MLREMFGYSTLEKEAGSVWTKWLEAILCGSVLPE
jgi:hypothetical protein